ncbi:ATP-binding protein [Myxococcota bacterium]
MTTKKSERFEPGDPRVRIRRLGLCGLLACWNQIADQPWISQLLEIEETERQRRSLDRRLRYAKIGSFKPMDRFDWHWPRKIDRTAIEDIFGLACLEDGANVIFVGPNGVARTMLMQNVAYHAVLQGHTVRFASASDMLADLAAQDSPSALARRMRRWTLPRLLCVDEVGYLSYSSRYADLLFEVVTRRYELGRPIFITTNKAFSDWSEVFPHAACTVTLVDRLVHRSEIIEIDGESYRAKEARERAAAKAKSRKQRRGSRAES